MINIISVKRILNYVIRNLQKNIIIQSRIYLIRFIRLSNLLV
nr:MAG TPA: hypothetical protein [Caudoviricetes sp.]